MDNPAGGEGCSRDGVGTETADDSGAEIRVQETHVPQFQAQQRNQKHHEESGSVAQAETAGVNEPVAQHLPAMQFQDVRGLLGDAADWARGPHAKSNWLLKGKVLVGGWPFRLPKGRGSPGETEEEGVEKLRSILAAGVATFVNMTEQGEIRGKLYCYATFKSQAEALHKDLVGPRRRQKQLGRELRFMHCPMPDGAVTSDGHLARFLQQLLEELRGGRVLYIHCYGGHGRTGIVGCALLCLLFGASSAEAVEVFNALHSERVDCGVGGPGQFPHSDAQQEQVDRVAARSGPFLGLSWDAGPSNSGTSSGQLESN